MPLAADALRRRRGRRVPPRRGGDVPTAAGPRCDPSELLGLTATPERTDGVDVRSFFDGSDGRRAAPVGRAGSGPALPLPLLRGQRRHGPLGARVAARRLRRRCAGTRLHRATTRGSASSCGSSATRSATSAAMRASASACPSSHAEFMAARFNAAGHPCASRSPASPPARSARRRWQPCATARSTCLFAVDLFNEGLDVPDVDTLLLLRPTQSATVFLQQLGRGLRRTADKPVLTVLDFIGQQRREFRFDLKYRALTGTTRVGLERQVEQGFGYLPSGCELVLDPVAQQTVLDNVRRQLRLTRRELVAEVRSPRRPRPRRAGCGRAAASWPTFPGNGSWTALRRAAGLPTPAAGPDEERLLRRCRRSRTWTTPSARRAYARLLSRAVDYDGPRRPGAALRAHALLLALAERRGHRQLPGRLRRAARPSGGAGPSCASASPSVSPPRSTSVAAPRAGHGAASRCVTHARYSREEVLAALDCALAVAQALVLRRGRRVVGRGRDGRLLRHAAEDRARLLADDDVPRLRPVARAVPLGVAERDVGRVSGRAAVPHPREPAARTSLLLAREHRTNEWGGTGPYTCLGPASYVSHRGDRPIAITWALRHPLTADLFRDAAVTA